MSKHIDKPVLGIVGGSGVYDIEGLENAEWRALTSSFGEPSDQALFGKFDGLDVVSLPRHGRVI
jgi:5'-methylthioadenosine phosphorylase